MKANKTATERAADILVAEFSELTTKELGTVFNTLKKDDGISLFLAIDRDMRVICKVVIAGAPHCRRLACKATRACQMRALLLSNYIYSRIEVQNQL